MRAQFESFVFHNNIAERKNATEIVFGDQIVYLSMYLIWKAASQSLEDIKRSLRFIKDELVTAPGYFIRDHIYEDTLDGLAVTSDWRNAIDNQMSLDQLVHLLRGFYVLNEWINDTEITKEVKTLAHDIGVRLKVNGYIIKTPQGEVVSRGSDARLLAWPIAQTIANITGNPISDYLESTGFSRNIYSFAIKLLASGWFSWVGHKYSIVLLNCLYYTSEFSDCNYLKQIEKDGDLLNGLLIRFARNEKMSQQYRDALNDSSWTGSNRWVYLPGKPKDDWVYNGLDFLTYQTLMGLNSY